MPTPTKPMSFCAKCGYDVAGVTEHAIVRCPECGRPIDKPLNRREELVRIAMDWRTYVPTLVTIVCFSPMVATILIDNWHGSVGVNFGAIFLFPVGLLLVLLAALLGLWSPTRYAAKRSPLRWSVHKSWVSFVFLGANVVAHIVMVGALVAADAFWV